MASSGEYACQRGGSRNLQNRGLGAGDLACYCTILGSALLAHEFYIEKSKFGQK